jgi:N-acetylglutamate synthase-like GNAT family acetyltransferase
VTIRDATAADVPRMREIARAAKGYWGYDAERVRAWSEELAFPHERAQWIAECDGVAVAYAALLPPEGGVCELDDLWVDPAFMGQRIGRELFAKAVDRARELGAAALRLEAEPNAVGFYERMGAHRAGTAIGSWGRELPVMRLDLA